MSENESPAKPSSFRNFLKNGLVLSIVAICAAYWISTQFVKGNILIELITMVLIGMLVVVVYRWSFVAADGLSRGETGGRVQISLGIVAFSLSTICILIWSLFWRRSGYPEWMMEHPFLGFMRLWSVFGVGLMITAPGTLNGSIPPSNWRWIIFAMVIGAGLFGYSLGMSASGSGPVPTPVARFANLPKCDDTLPVWVSQSGRYHGLNSPYRLMIKVPIACFATEQEARAAGYRPPR